MKIKDIWEINRDDSPGKPVSDKKDRCGGIIRTLFNTEKDGNGTCYEEGASGTYYLILENVTPIMSIGIATEKFQGLLKKYDYQYDVALKKYNIGSPGYAERVMERVNMWDSFVGD